MKLHRSFCRLTTHIVATVDNNDDEDDDDDDDDDDTFLSCLKVVTSEGSHYDNADYFINTLECGWGGTSSG